MREKLGLVSRGVRFFSPLLRSFPAGRYRMARWLGMLARRPFPATMSPRLDRLKFWCDLRDFSMRETFLFGCRELAETVLLTTLLKPEMTFVDVGANWGYFTLVGAWKVGPRGKVLGFEPDPAMFERLRKNIELNHFSSVGAFALAVSNQRGWLTFDGFCQEDENWGLTHVVGDNRNPAKRRFAACGVGLDSFLDDQGIGRVDVLKMDIEGGEDRAIRGMARGISFSRYRTVLLEFHGDVLAERGIRSVDALGPFLESGYQIWRFEQRPLWRLGAAISSHYWTGSSVLRECKPEGLAEYCHLLCSAPGIEVPAGLVDGLPEVR